jgi:non-specific serine/threonine protein kinase
LLGAAATLRQAAAAAPSAADRVYLDRVAALARLALGDDAYSEHWVAGEGLSVVEAVEYGLTVEQPSLGDPMAPRNSGNQLTPREREVVGLVARGMSNREIAEALIVTERTVEAHVSKALGKLGLNSRTQVAILVARGDGAVQQMN